MARLDLSIDCDAKRSVVSSLSNDSKPVPFFVQGNTPLLRIRLYQNWTRASGLELIPTDDLTLQVALWSSADTVLAAQYVWTPYDGEYFEAELALNTAEIDTWLGSSTDKKANFQIDYLRAGVPTTVYLEQVTVKATGIDLNALVPVPTPTPLSAEAAQAMFVKLHEERPIYLVGAAGTELKVWNDDTLGTPAFKADNAS